MQISQIVKEAVETLAALKAFANIPVVPDDVGNIDAKLAAEVGKQTVCLIVGWSGFTPDKQNESEIVGKTELVVSVFENPQTNRLTKDALTIFDISIAVAKCLTYARAEGMESPLFLKEITPLADVDGKGTVTCNVVFTTKAEL